MFFFNVENNLIFVLATTTQAIWLNVRHLNFFQEGFFWENVNKKCDAQLIKEHFVVFSEDKHKNSVKLGLVYSVNLKG